MTDLIPQQIAASSDPAGCCIECGYILFKLAPAGNCPECGVPIARSIHRIDFSQLTRRRARCLRLGLSIWLLAVALPTLLTVLYTIVVMKTWPVWSSSPPPDSAFSRAWRLMVFAWRSSVEWSIGLRFIAFLLIAAANLGVSSRARTFFRIPIALTALSLTGVLWSFLGTWDVEQTPLIVFNIAIFLLFAPTLLAEIIMWISLSLCVDPRANPRLFKAMWMALWVLLIGAAGVLVEGANHPMWWFAFSRRGFFQSVVGDSIPQIIEACVSYAYLLASAVMILALGAFEQAVRNSSAMNRPNS